MFCGFAKLAVFTTNVEAENRCLIKHKCMCVALNHQFVEGAVLQAGVLPVVALLSIVYHVQVRWLGGSFGFYCFSVGLCEIANPLPNLWENIVLYQFDCICLSYDKLCFDFKSYNDFFYFINKFFFITKMLFYLR